VMLADGRLSAGHGRALVGHENVMAFANEIVKKGLSVREAEALARKRTETGDTSGKAGKTGAPAKDADTRALEQRLSSAIGMKVEIDHKGEKGAVTIHYRSLEQLDDICKRLAK